VKNHFSENDVKQMLLDINQLERPFILKKYDFKETDDWTIDGKKKLFQIDDLKSIVKINYRPFDFRFTYYPLDKISEIIPRGDSRKNLMKNIVLGSLGFICFRQSRNEDIGNFWITNKAISKDIISALDSATLFPLYLYQIPNNQQRIQEFETRTPNFNKEMLNQIVEKLSLTFVAEREDGNVCFANNNDELRDEFKSVFAPIDLLDYIYAVLHSPAYREKYKEFLKIDFPRVPYPEDAGKFWQLVKLGGEIRQLHLLESAAVNKFITKYPIDGSNVVAKPVYKEGKVYINDTQYFDQVPLTAWEFYIGGYQPAQKWLKDRKDRELSFEDIQHYQKIIVALTETDRLMKEIDLVGVV
jgi:predicted helicase